MGIKQYQFLPLFTFVPVAERPILTCAVEQCEGQGSPVSPSTANSQDQTQVAKLSTSAFIAEPQHFKMLQHIWIRKSVPPVAGGVTGTA